MLRRQTNEDNKGIVDLADDNNHSLTRQGYLHCSGTEFTPELLGGFGDFISRLVGDGFVVELGCGSAVISAFCPGGYLGLDGNREAGNHCKGEFFAVDLIKPVDFDPPVQADWLLSFNFFEHIEEQFIDNLLENADKLLKPGGKVFLLIDTIDNGPEHVTLKGEAWWDERLRKYWVKEEVSAEFKKDYLRSVPKHWKIWGTPKTQVIYRYHKED